MFPAYFPYEKDLFEKITDNRLLVNKIDENIQKTTIGEKIKVKLMNIKSTYSQKHLEKPFFNAEEINAEVLKPAEAREAKFQKWKFADIKKIHIKKLKSLINQVNFKDF